MSGLSWRGEELWWIMWRAKCLVFGAFLEQSSFSVTKGKPSGHKQIKYNVCNRCMNDSSSPGIPGILTSQEEEEEEKEVSTLLPIPEEDRVLTVECTAFNLLGRSSQVFYHREWFPLKSKMKWWGDPGLSDSGSLLQNERLLYGFDLSIKSCRFQVQPNFIASTRQFWLEL